MKPAIRARSIEHTLGIARCQEVSSLRWLLRWLACGVTSQQRPSGSYTKTLSDEHDLYQICIRASASTLLSSSPSSGLLGMAL
jgi:hypothetical protein